MASAGGPPCEEQLLCSICLDVFNEPVSTPCGHNYCKACITGYWASSGSILCPLCKKRFRKRPQLQVNTGFRDMVEHFNSMRARDEDGVLAKPGEVPCDICLVPKLKAQKTCLVCLASYCQPHLDPHQRVATLKKHPLVDPAPNLEDRVCRKHGKAFELFCREDQTCVCFVCLKDDHATHEAVPLEHAFRERKVQLDYVTSEMKVMENAKSRSIKGIKCSAEQGKKEAEREVAEVFAALAVSLQRSQAKLTEVIQGKQKAAQKQAEDRVTQLEQEIVESRRRRAELEQLSQTEDHLHLLQSWPSLYFRAHIADLFNPLSPSTPPFTLDLIGQQSYVRMVKKAVAQMEKTLGNEMEMLIHEVRFSDSCEAAERPDAAETMTDWFVKEVWTPPQDKLMMIQQSDAMDVTLDAYSAHLRLVVSEDGKRMRFGALPSHVSYGRRFARQPFVLGKEGFSSGRFYYEVQVSGSKGWVLGVVRESINRETFLFPTPEEGRWTLCGSYDHVEYFANTYSNATVYLRERPRTVGVFVDYEKGEVSFYDVDARSLIYSYKGCTFIEAPPALKAFLYFMAGTSLSSRPKLYPIFGILEDDYDNTLEITPVACAT